MKKKDIDRRITKAFNARCSGIPIPMMSIPGIFRVGREAIAAGADDEALGDAIAKAVELVK
jgi:hypothetical protein